MMKNPDFSFDERMLLCIYTGADREEVMEKLTEMMACLEPSEQAICQLAETTLEKLRQTSDQAFAELELFPDF